MGKTTLAVAALHHPAVARSFGRRTYFVPCDAADGLVSGSFRLLAEGLGMTAPDKETAKGSLLKFFRGKRSLLVLDNYESAWEEPEQREDAEELLQFLNSFPTLALVVTLRGAERPHGASWSRPFLPPLHPLSDAAAQQTFLSISGAADVEPATDALLAHLENIPLTVVLMANLAQYESPGMLLNHWEELETQMLVRSGGETRHTSLDVSIRLSVQSPRMAHSPAAQRLLSVLSILPFGAMDTDLGLWGITTTPHALSVLLRAALATRTSAQRIYVLAPIRRYMLAHHPPEEADLLTLCDHFFGLADVAAECAASGLADPETFAAVVPELANIDSLIRHAARDASAIPIRTVETAVRAADRLCEVHKLTGVGPGPELLPLALGVARAAKHEQLEAALVAHWASLAFEGTMPGDAKSLYEESRDIYARIGDEEGRIGRELALVAFLGPEQALVESRRLYACAEKIQHLGFMAQSCSRAGYALHRLGRKQGAIAQHEQAIAFLLQSAPDNRAKVNRRIAANRYQLAAYHRLANDFDAATTAYHDALALYKGVHDPHGECRVYAMLAETAILRGRLRETIDYASAALDVKDSKGARIHIDCLFLVAEAHILVADYTAGSAALERLADEFAPAGGFSLVEQSRILRLRGLIPLHRGDLPEARALLGAARQVTRTPGPVIYRGMMQAMETMVTVHLCELECSAGRAAEAVVLGVCAAVAFRAAGNPADAAATLVFLAEAVDDELAERLVGAVMLPLLRYANSGGLAAALMRAATVSEHRGEHALAVQRARAALRYFGEIKEERYLQIAKRILAE